MLAKLSPYVIFLLRATVRRFAVSIFWSGTSISMKNKSSSESFGKSASLPIGYSGTSQIHPRNSPSPSTITTHLIHPSIDRPHSPSSQTASGSNQPFCQSTLSGQTDQHTHTQTDRWDRRQLDSISAYARYIERRANNEKETKQAIIAYGCLCANIQEITMPNA